MAGLIGFHAFLLLSCVILAESLTTVLVYDGDSDNSTIQSCLDVLKSGDVAVRPYRVNMVESLESIRSDVCTRMAETDDLAMILDYSRLQAVNSLLDGLSQQLHVPHLRMGSAFQPEFGRHDFQLQVYPGAVLQLLLLKDFLRKERKEGRWQAGAVVLPTKSSDLHNLATLMQNVQQPLVIRKWTNVMEENNQMFEEVAKTSVKNFIVGLAPEQLNEFFVLMAAKRMLTFAYTFLLTHPEASTADLSTFAYSGAEIVAFRPELGSGSSLMLTKLTEIAKDLAAPLKSSPPSNWRPRCSGEAWRDGRRAMDAILANADGKFGLIRNQEELSCPSLKHRFHVMSLNTEGYAKTFLWRYGLGFADLRRQLRSLRQKRQSGTIRVVTIESVPFSIYRTEDETGKPLSGNDRYTGMSIEIFKKIAEKLKLTYIISSVPDGKYGVYNDRTDKWNGMIGELVERRADIAAADLTITSARAKRVDYTSPFVNLGITLVIKKPQVLKTSIDFCAAFKPEVWILVIFCLVVTSLVLFVIARLSPAEWHNTNSTTKVNYFSLADCFWFITGASLFRGTDLMPRALGTRVVGFVWWIFILLVVIAYAVTIQSFVPNADRMVVPIKDMKELASQTKIRYGSIKGGSTYSLFKKSETSMYKVMYESMKMNPQNMVNNSKEGIDRVLSSDSDYAFILESTMANYYKARDCRLMQVGDVLHPRSFGFALAKGSALTSQFSGALLQLQEKGALEKIKQYWLYEYKISTPCDIVEKPTRVPLTAFLMYRLFVGLFVGLILAFIVCVVELIVRAFRESGGGVQAISGYLIARFRLVFCLCSGEDKQKREEEEEQAAEPALKLEVEVNDSDKP